MLGLFGLSHTDAAIRVFGSLLGILTVAGILLLVRRVSGRPTGLLAGLLVALSPVLVWYSQELRMFQPAATGAVWTAYALLRAWDGRTWQRRLGWWLLFVLVLEAALLHLPVQRLRGPRGRADVAGAWPLPDAVTPTPGDGSARA